MSYDVKLLVNVPASGTPEEHLDRPANKAERNVLAQPLSPEALRRIEAVMADLRLIDPAAVIEELREGGHLCGFAVADSAQLPYIEFDSEGGTLNWSMGAEPRVLYRSLMQLTSLAARHGYLAFDCQQGAFIKTSDDFVTFMQQFADQWSSPENFKKWLAVDAPAQQSKKSNVLAWVTLALLITWGAYKLSKAGYF